MNVLSQFGGKEVLNTTSYVGDKQYSAVLVRIKADDYRRAIASGAITLSKQQATTTVKKGEAFITPDGVAINTARVKKLANNLKEALTSSGDIIVANGQVTSGNHRTCAIQLSHSKGLFDDEAKNLLLTIKVFTDKFSKEDFTTLSIRSNDSNKSSTGAQIINSGTEASEKLLKPIKKMLQKKTGISFTEETYDTVLRLAEILNKDAAILIIQKTGSLPIDPEAVHKCKSTGFMDKGNSVQQALCPLLKDRYILDKNLAWLEKRLGGYFEFIKLLKSKEIKSLVPKSGCIQQAVLAHVLTNGLSVAQAKGAIKNLARNSLAATAANGSFSGRPAISGAVILKALKLS